jgi:hypothetical protein
LCEVRVPAPTTVSVDRILAVQLAASCAGESRETKNRLRQRQTDVIESMAGSDLVACLLPRTHASGSVEAVRETARRADWAAKRGMADPDQARALSLLGFDLEERFAELKQHGQPPAPALAFPLALGAPRSRQKVAEALGLGSVPAYDEAPGGRQDDHVDDHALAVSIADRSARMPKRRGRT